LYSKRTDESSYSTGLLRVDFFGELKNNADSTVEMYFYNGLNRLKEVRKGGITAQYTYNAEGIRTSKTVNGITIDFYLDGVNVVAETKGTETINYIRGVLGIIYGEILGSSNSRKHYTSDGHGNITNLINNSGLVVKTYDYDAFGVEENIDSADTNPFRYCGEYYDSEINQIYLRARYYSPELGRFNQQDTHWTPDNMVYGDESQNNLFQLEQKRRVIQTKINTVLFSNVSSEQKIIEISRLNLRRLSKEERDFFEYEAQEIKKVSIESINQNSNLYIYCISNPLIYIDAKGENVYVISASAAADAGFSIGVSGYVVFDDLGNIGIVGLISGGGYIVGGGIGVGSPINYSVHCFSMTGIEGWNIGTWATGILKATLGF